MSTKYLVVSQFPYWQGLSGYHVAWFENRVIQEKTHDMILDRSGFCIPQPTSSDGPRGRFENNSPHGSVARERKTFTGA